MDKGIYKNVSIRERVLGIYSRNDYPAFVSVIVTIFEELEARVEKLEYSAKSLSERQQDSKAIRETLCSRCHGSGQIQIPCPDGMCSIPSELLY